MKKCMLILLVIVILLVGCSNGDRIISDFEDYKDDLTIVSDTAMDYFVNNSQNVEYLTLDIAQYLSWANISIEESISKISELNVDYIWVSSDYVIFWKDETKTYGIMYSKSPRSTIKELKSWYTSMDYNKIEKHWYEIGQLNTL